MTPKFMFTIAFNLLIINILAAQIDTTKLPNLSDAMQIGDIEVVERPKKRSGAVYSFAIGSPSIFNPNEETLDGTDKQFIKNVNWIPLSIKGEYFLSPRFSTGFSVNIVNNQRIYDALWNNYRTNTTESHRFTIVQKRTSFLWRNNFYFVNNLDLQGYIGFGLGFALRDQEKSVYPSAFEYGGSGELDFLFNLGLELSAGLRFYPFNSDRWGILLEGGLMQSFGRVGVSYRLRTKEETN